jgi:type VI protein secretion system component Hcp
VAQLDAFMILVGDDGVIPGETVDREMSVAKVTVGGRDYTGAAIEIINFTLSGWVSDTSRYEPSEKKTTPRLNDKLTLSVTKNLDSSSPFLMSAYCQHLQTALTKVNLKPFKQLKIIVRKVGDIRGSTSQQQYLDLVFGEVYLASYSCGGAHSANMDMPTENLEFRFKTVSMWYTPQKATGHITIATRIPMDWNFYGPSSA